MQSKNIFKEEKNKYFVHCGKVTKTYLNDQRKNRQIGIFLTEIGKLPNRFRVFLLRNSYKSLTFAAES